MTSKIAINIYEFCSGSDSEMTLAAGCHTLRIFRNFKSSHGNSHIIIKKIRLTQGRFFFKSR